MDNKASLMYWSYTALHHWPVERLLCFVVFVCPAQEMELIQRGKPCPERGSWTTCTDWSLCYPGTALETKTQMLTPPLVSTRCLKRVSLSLIASEHGVAFVPWSKHQWLNCTGFMILVFATYRIAWWPHADAENVSFVHAIPDQPLKFKPGGHQF